MERARDLLLAGARLSVNGNRKVGRSGLSNQVTQTTDRLRRTHKARKELFGLGAGQIEFGVQGGRRGRIHAEDLAQVRLDNGQDPAITEGFDPPEVVLDRIALKNAVVQLPPGYRKVFVLHDVEGYEHEEVARLLGISVGTSKSQLHKARLKLRGLLIKQNEA